MIPFLALAALALASPAAGPSGQGTRILREAAESEDNDIERLAKQLGALPPEQLPELFSVLASGEVPGEKKNAAGIELDPVLRVALLESFGLHAPAHVRAFIAGLDPLTDPARMAALEVLGETGRADDVDLILDIATPRGPEAFVTRDVRKLATEALTRTLARDPRAIWDLHTAYEHAHPGLVVGVPAAIGAARPPEGLQVLTDLLGVVPELDPIVLVEIGTFAEAVDGPVDPMVIGKVRDHLGHGDPHIIRGAALAVGKLDDTLAVEDLIRLLHHSDLNVRSSADSALQRIADRDVRGEAARWETWYADELAWRDREGPRCLDQLMTSDRAFVAAALNEVATHRLFRHEFEDAIVGTLSWKDPGIVILACGVIGQLGTRSALPELRALAAGSDPALSRASEGALRALLGPAFEPTSMAVKR
jgi:HEAT repeat protein